MFERIFQDFFVSFAHRRSFYFPSHEKKTSLPDHLRQRCLQSEGL